MITPAGGFQLRMSPSLRGSGLKFPVLPIGQQILFVSLFTREWIEIRCKTGRMGAA